MFFDFRTDEKTIIAFLKTSGLYSLETLFSDPELKVFLDKVRARDEMMAVKAYVDSTGAGLKEAVLASKIARSLLK